MFALTESMNYYLCPHYVDMRKGIYSLYQLVKSDMKRNPLSGEVFLFQKKASAGLPVIQSSVCYSCPKGTDNTSDIKEKHKQYILYIFVYQCITLVLKPSPVLCGTNRDALHYQDKSLPFHLKFIA